MIYTRFPYCLKGRDGWKPRRTGEHQWDHPDRLQPGPVESLGRLPRARNISCIPRDSTDRGDGQTHI